MVFTHNDFHWVDGQFNRLIALTFWAKDKGLWDIVVEGEEKKFSWRHRWRTVYPIKHERW